MGIGFPWGTLTVNGIGCFMFGMIWSITEHRLAISSEFRIIALVGFLGAFTTFSSFAFETAQLLRDSQWWLATGNILAQNLVGIIFLFLGISLGRMV